jgi:hypothetical protein
MRHFYRRSAFYVGIAVGVALMLLIQFWAGQFWALWVWLWT